MLHLAQNLWNDQAGFVVSAEMVLISTVGVIGVGTGLVCVRDAVNRELSEVACAISALDQSYCYTGFHSYKDPCHQTVKAQTAGSSYPPLREVDSDVAPAVEGELLPIPEDHPDHGRIFRERETGERIIEERVIRRPIPEDNSAPRHDKPRMPRALREEPEPTPVE